MNSSGFRGGSVFRVLLGCATLLSGVLVSSEASDTQFKTRSIEPFNYTQTLETTGKLRPSRDLIIKSKISENVQSLTVDEGETVTTGQQLLQFDTALKKVNLDRARHRRDRARQQLEIARKDYHRKKSLLEKDLISESEYDQSQLEFNRARAEHEIARTEVREAEIRYSHTSVESPFPGLVEEKRVELGERANRGQPLIHFLRVNPAEVHFEVTSEERTSLSPGDTITLRPNSSSESDTGPTPFHRGTIYTVNQDAGPNGLYTVKARISNGHYELTPGRTVRVRMPLRRYENIVEIPLSFVDRTTDRPRTVLFDPEEEELHHRPLTIVDYREESLLVQLQWPESWKFVPGGIYADLPGKIK
jgi:RND family efflux transporter MFP subunit